jgi:phage/conjugal plasmid C-4 type zinc finger TraR family protein
VVDICDLAQAHETRVRRQQVERAVAVARRGGESAEHCAWCGEAIPEARQLAVPGCTTCVGCQAELERRHR